MSEEGGTIMQPPRVVQEDRGPTLEGTRLTVYYIIPLLEKGYSADYIGAVYGLSREEVQVLIQYIEEHKEEVMAKNAEIDARAARGNPPEIRKKLKASRSKFRAIKQALLQKKDTEDNGARHPH